MTQPQDKMRAEFESWAKDQGYQRDELARSTLSLVCPEYFNLNTEMSWKAWQAACTQQAAQSQQDALDAARWRWATEQAEFFPMVMDGTGLLCADIKEAEEAVDAEISTQGASNV